MSKRILVTGGCGFIGHHLVEHLLKNTDWSIIVLDKLSYASNGFDRLRDIESYDATRVEVFTIDLDQPVSHGVAKEIGSIQHIVHMAAETHVDNSIRDPSSFVVSNVLGTAHILDYARTLSGLERVLYFSTDEVFGPAPPEVEFREWDCYNSSNPYAATKAGGEELALAYANTYKLPVLISHCMNVFGERQHTEKFIPLVIRKILLNETVTIHADANKTKSGSRRWIHARNVANAVQFILERGKVRDKYNITGEREADNLYIAKFIASVIGKPLLYEMTDYHSARPGHDLRYAMSGQKMKDMGWIPQKPFEDSLRRTVEWTLDNKKWINL